MNDSSKDSLREPMDRYGERLDRDHDQLRAELMSSLPDSPDEVLPPKTRLRGRLLGDGTRLARRWLKLAAMLAIVTTSLGVLVWMQSGRATAGVAFAEVLRQAREACTVRYKSTLRLGDAAPRTSEIVSKEPGYERKTMPDGQLQIIDPAHGKTIYVEPQVGWTLTVEQAPGTKGPFSDNDLQRLKNLPEEAGKLIGEEELDGQPVSVFEVSDKNDRITIWADSRTGLPLKIEVVSEPSGNGDGQDHIEAILTLSDFVWNEPIDDSLFRCPTPEGYEHYHIQLIDTSRPVEEKDLVEALRIFCDLGDGAFPDSLYTKHLGPLQAKLEQPATAKIDTGTGMALVAGLSEPVRAGVAPPLVRFMRANKKRMQIHRGVKFVQQLIADKIPWRYLGKGVRRDEQKPVFEYRPDRSSKTSRIIFGDFSTQTHEP